MWRRVVVALAGAAWLASVGGGVAGAQALSPLQAANAWVAAVNAGDAAGALALFAPNGSIQTPRQRHEGTAAVRDWLAEHTALHVRITPVGQPEVSGNTVAWTASVTRDDWNALGVGAIEHRYEANVTDGRITGLQFAFALADEARLRAAQDRARAAAAPAPVQLPRTGGGVAPRLGIAAGLPWLGIAAGLLLAAGATVCGTNRRASQR